MRADVAQGLFVVTVQKIRIPDGRRTVEDTVVVERPLALFVDGERTGLVWRLPGHRVATSRARPLSPQGCPDTRRA